MNRVGKLLVLFGTLLLVGCGEKEKEPPGTLTGGAGGTGGGGGNGGLLMPYGGMPGVGAFAGRFSVNPPSTVDLQTCAHVLDDPDASEECFYCCADKGFENEAIFDGKCACSMPIDSRGATICASQQTLDPCSSCCSDAGYYGVRVNENVPGTCTCLHRSDPEICASSAMDSAPRTACAACCINAGYVSSSIPAGGCVCSDG